MISTLRGSLRRLRAEPGFTLAAVATLGLGLGAATLIFSVVDAVLLRPLPYHEPERLVWAWGRMPGATTAAVSPPDFQDYVDRNRSFESLAAMVVFPGRWALTGDGPAEQIAGATVSSNFFATLGVAPLLGPGFTEADQRARDPRVVVLSHGLWQRRFGGDPSIVGRALRLDTRSVTVAGVLPPDFRPLQEAEAYVPMPLDLPEMQVRRFHFLRVVGRLRPGVSLEAAQRDVDAVARSLEAEYPESNRGWGLRLQSLHEQVTGELRPLVVLLAAAVALLLAVACANVAHLLLARGARRAHELAVRAALGARGLDLAAPMVADALAVGVAGAALGLLLARAGVDAVAALGLGGLPRFDEVGLHGRSFAAAFGLSIVTALVAALVPAWHAMRSDPKHSLAGRSAAAAPRAASRVRAALVVGEIAVTFALLAAGGLLLRTLHALDRREAGFETESRLTAQVRLPLARYAAEGAGGRFFAELLERVRQQPGVRAAGTVSIVPLSGGRTDVAFAREGEQLVNDGQRNAQYRVADPGYFDTLGIPLIRGRAFDARDRPGAPAALIVNEPFVRAFLAGRDPIGRTLTLDVGEPLVATVVGVVAGTRARGALFDPSPELYVAQAQSPLLTTSLVVHAEAPLEQVTARLREALAALDPEVPLGGVDTLEGLRQRSVAVPRVRAVLVTVFAAATLLLAAVGLAGVIGVAVAHRTAEVGVRVALGARPRQVLTLFARDALRLSALGLTLGVVATAAGVPLIASFLHDTAPFDPATAAAVAAVVLLTAAIATWVPARRALQVEPTDALRAE
jgi:predicted permease